MSRFGITGRAAAAYLLLAGLQRGVSLLILPFISHAMLPSEYGAASTLTASAMLIVAIIAAPVEQLVFRAAARGGDDAPALIRVAGTYCYLVLPLFIACVAAGSVVYLPDLFGISGQIWAIELLAVGFLPAATYFALPFVRARQDLRKFVWLAATSILVTALSKFLLIVVWGLGVFGWAISDLVSAVVSALLAIALIRLPRVHVAARNICAVLTFSIPLIPHRASFWALSSLSRPAMATVSTLAQVGLLSFGLNLAAVANMILAELNQAFQPRYSREKFPAPNGETRKPVHWQLVLAFAIPALVGASVALGGQFIFAESYWPSFALTGLLLCGQVAYGLYLVPMNYIVQSAGLPKFSALASVSGATIILVGILALGRQYGAVGVAYVTSSGFAAMAVVAFILTRILRLNISWSSWLKNWPEIALGLAGLVCSIAALVLIVGSTASYIFAVASIVLTVYALALTAARRSS